MSDESTPSIYASLGLRPVVNAATSWTVLGGTLMPPEVLDAMREAASSYVDIHELQAAVGREIAQLTRNESAYVSNGAAAGLTLSVLAARTRGKLDAIAQLIDGDQDLPDEVVVHSAHRIPYDPAVRLAGAVLRPIGNVLQTFDYELESAIGPPTAAVLYVVGSFVAPGALPLERVVELAHRRGVPVIVDAAGQLPPVSNFWRFTTELGADLAVFSGGKELRGPQSSGLIVGSADWISAVAANGPPHQRLARALKVGKEEMVGLLAAVQRFVAIDHERHWHDLHGRSRAFLDSIVEVPGVTASVEARNAAGARLPRIRIDFDPDLAACDADAVAAALFEGEPRIAVRGGRGPFIHIELNLVSPEDAAAVLRRLNEELAVRDHRGVEKPRREV